MRVLLISFIALLIANEKSSDLNLKILNKVLVSGDFVNLVIKNNSTNQYCFVIDTNFFSRSTFINNDIFQNPTVVLHDKLGATIKKNIELRRSQYRLDSIGIKSKPNNAILNVGDTLFVDELQMYSKLYKKGFVNTLTIFNVNPKQSIIIKVPFNLVTKYKKDNVKEYYDVKKTNNYDARIEYFVTRDFIQKSLSKAKIDSIESKGVKIFTGELVSNKIPLKLNR